MALSLDKFAANLVECGLLSEAELSAFRTEHNPADAEQMARGLVKQKMLTAYQAQQVYAGKAKALTMGNYVILDKLGQGGMGMVLKARHKRMNRIVALKVLSPTVVKTPEALARFHREVQAAARLEHQNIVIAYDADEANGTHFFVMQYVEGSDLSAVVKKQGVLAIDQAIHCVTQAARGLEFAHKHGVIHRDIKPANLLLDNDGTVKILDMGLARIEGETGVNAELTSTGAVMGTIDYMAPEQALSTKSADARSDVYSLGVTIWYLLVGRPVYEGESLMARLMAHANNPIPSLTAARADVPAGLDAVYQRMVAKKPADRFQSMTQVIAALDACQRVGIEASAAPSAVVTSSEQSKLSYFLGQFEGGTDPLAGPVGSLVGKPTVKLADQSASVYEATVRSAQPDAGTDLASLRNESRTKKPKKKPRPWWMDRRVQIGGAVAALLLIVSGFLLPGSKPAAVVSPNPSGGVASPGLPPVSTTLAASAIPATAGVTLEPRNGLAAQLNAPNYEWSPPVNLGAPVNSSDHEANPRLSADGLRLFFTRRGQLFVSNRTRSDAPWEAPRLIQRPAGWMQPIGDPFLTPDEKQLFFSTWGEKSEPISLRHTTRADLDSPWTAPTFVRQPGEYGSFPVLSADGLTLYFTSIENVNNVGGDDLFTMSRRTPEAPWSGLTNLGTGVNSNQVDRLSWVSPDECVLLFHSNRGMADSTRYRLYMATRPTREDVWGPAGPIGPPAAGPDDMMTCASLSPDGTTLYFESTRAGGLGAHDLWSSRLVPKGRAAPPTLAGEVNFLADIRSGILSLGGGLNAKAGVIFHFKDVPIPDSYTLTFDLDRLAGSESTTIALIVGGHSCRLHLHGDGVDYNESFSGLELIDGLRFTDPKNPTSTNTRFVPSGKPFQLICRVQPNRVSASLDGTTFLDWQGDASRLSPTPAHVRSISQAGNRLSLLQFRGMLKCTRATMTSGVVAAASITNDSSKSLQVPP